MVPISREQDILNNGLIRIGTHNQSMLGAINLSELRNLSQSPRDFNQWQVLSVETMYKS